MINAERVELERKLFGGAAMVCLLSSVRPKTSQQGPTILTKRIVLHLIVLMGCFRFYRVGEMLGAT